MSRTSLVFVLSAALLSATPALAQDHADGHGHAAGTVAAGAAEAATAVDAFHAALKGGDTAAALALMSPDVMIFEGGYVERSRDEYASHHLGSDAAFAASSQAVVERRSGWIDGAVAWITSEGRTTGQFNGRPVDSLTTETMVLKRHADGWRIHHIHWSSRTPS
ncbi:nuclear transport factor 2 family protein [Brevundimonas sp. Root1423]|uniref:YybH family protein n=1 Tax=Brevundimonas sp. Root1423 TaxID=1736462 RepID=UPI0006FA70EC|nr:nuclear transport factor 2 family protein [Brevundimonas sp. Root1423]KQY85018.1 protein kinase [Brevundimonas sp. Root1423]